MRAAFELRKWVHVILNVRSVFEIDMNGWQRFKLTAPIPDSGGDRSAIMHKNRLVVLPPSGSRSGRQNMKCKPGKTPQNVRGAT
jgi:hypothetical protein